MQARFSCLADQKALAASKLIALLKDSFETVLRRRSTALALHPLRCDIDHAAAVLPRRLHGFENRRPAFSARSATNSRTG